MGMLELGNNIFQIIVLGVLALLTGRLVLQKPQLKFLSYFGGGMLCYFLGDVFWTLYFVIKGDFPYYISISDISYVAAYLFLIVFCTMVQKEYGNCESTRKEKGLAYGMAGIALLVCWICYLLVGGFIWNFMYGVPLAILSYSTVIGIYRSKKSQQETFLCNYHLSVFLFIILNNLMFLVSSMGWNNLYITCDFLTTINFVFMFYSLTREGKV